MKMYVAAKSHKEATWMAEAGICLRPTRELAQQSADNRNSFPHIFPHSDVYEVDLEIQVHSVEAVAP